MRQAEVATDESTTICREDGAEMSSRPAPASAPPSAGSSLARVHIITVHHRGRAMLDLCLRSLLLSEGVELEIIVVSNHCLEPLPAIAHESPQIHRVETGRSIGFSAANNLGVDWARRNLGEPDFYYFINNDTESKPAALGALVAALLARPEAAIAGPRLQILGSPDHLNSLGLNLTEDGWGWDEGIGIHLETYGPLPAKRPVVAVTGSALLMDSKAFRAVGGWTEIYDYYFEDIDLCLKVWESGREVIQVPDAIVLHQISATMTVGSDRKTFFFWRNRLLLTLIHWPAGRLWEIFKRVVGKEILSQGWSSSALQRRALGAALRRLPGILRERRRSPGRREWLRFLYPVGSVPVITLPSIGPSAADPPPPEEPAAVVAAVVAAEGPLPSEIDEGDPAVLRRRLREAEARLAAAEANLTGARQQLALIHSSKMWRIWMGYLAIRRVLTSPLRVWRR